MENKELDKSRAEFEAAMRDANTPEWAFERCSVRGDYVNNTIEAKFQGWLLARAGSAAPTGQQAEPVSGPHDDAVLSRTYLKAINHTAGLRAVYNLAAPTAAEGPSEILAWAHEDGRVVAASTMEAARRDGGAMRSSLAGYTIPLSRVVAPLPTKEGAGEVDAKLPDSVAVADEVRRLYPGAHCVGHAAVSMTLKAVESLRSIAAQPKDTTDTTKGQA